MGMNASADIFFGIVLFDPDEGESKAPWIDEDGEGEFEDYVIDGYSDIKSPEEQYPEEESETSEAIKAKYHAFWNAKREWMDQLVIEEDHVGYSDGYSKVILKLKNWGKRAEYDCEEIQPSELVVTDNQRATFMQALKDLDLSDLPEPAIHLVASYG